jgi:hypothetical protein
MLRNWEKYEFKKSLSIVKVKDSGELVKAATHSI